jgi:NAD(P)-dependent dehydrogenase (short-subunit alcohol dehydrogenase family)
MKLEAGQVAVITGGASGIGAAFAEAFADRGVSLVLCDVESSALERAVARLEQRGVTALGLKVDVTDAAQVERAATQAIDRFGRVDVICNNAGVAAAMKPMWEFSLDDWVWVMNVNLWGVINGIRAFVPHLIAQGQGHVVNTSSMAGISTVPFLGPYTATKHAVVGLSESLSAELAQHAPGVGVTVVCPGFVSTRLADAERNRPGAAAGGPDSDDPSPAMASGMDASLVARQTMAAIEANQLHIAPGPGNRVRINQRIDLLLADLDKGVEQ